MKRIFMLIMACVFLLTGIVPLACGGQNTITFEWEQPGDISDLFGWRMYVSEDVGGPYDDGQIYFRDDIGNPLDYVAIPFDGIPSSVYVGDAIIVVPDGAETELCFVLNAWDTSDNYSGNSNEVCKTFDFLPPGVPFNFRIKIITIP